MKVLLADKFEESGLNALRTAGFHVLYDPDLKDDALAQAISLHKPDALVVRSTKVRAQHILPELKLIVRAGAGYDNIDLKAATSNGTKVSNCPGQNAHAVAELAFGLLISLDRRIPDNVAELRKGRWNKKEFAKARGLYGRTLGIIGIGNIGRQVARLAKAAGMHIISYAPHLSQEDATALNVQPTKDLLTLAANSDAVTVHCALTPETEHLLSKNFFDAMKPGALFVNTSRAEVVDQNALLEAVETKNIRAALDVFEGEPSAPTGEYHGPLKDNPLVYCTHHIGASTDQAQEAVAAETVRILTLFAQTGRAENCVNP